MADTAPQSTLFDPGARLVVFDPNITRTSPAGSCLLAMLQPLIESCDIHLFISRTDLPDSKLLRKTKIPTPRRPVFLSAFLFTFLSACAHLVGGRRPGLKISTEGAFPFCDLCYAHSCHNLLLFRYGRFLGGGRLRRVARILTHTWGAMTERLAFHSATTIVVPSEGLARDLKSVYPKLVEGKIRIIPNPVDTTAFLPPVEFLKTRLRDELGIGANALVLSFCALGNFDRKGLGLILEAVAAARGLDIHLIVVGGSLSEVSEYRALAGSMGIAASIHFVGLQPDIRPYVWSSDAFVFASVYEGFPLVSLQAAAAGLPLITTRVNGVEEFMIDGVTGWIVQRTSASLRGAIQEAALDRGRLLEMGRAARERVQVYRQDRFQARWMELLRDEWALLR